MVTMLFETWTEDAGVARCFSSDRLALTPRTQTQAAYSFTNRSERRVLEVHRVRAVHIHLQEQDADVTAQLSHMLRCDKPNTPT